MKTIATFNLPVEAHLARSRLESAGIAVEIRDENFVTFYWLAANAIGGIRLDVPDEDAAAAREILALPPPEEGVLRCPHCGSSDTHVRPLSVFGGICLLLRLPIPMTLVTVDCRQCGKTFDAPIAGGPG